MVPAVSAAVDLLRSPARIRLARAAPLPEGIEILLQIVAGEAAATVAAAEALGRDEDTVRRAAEFFVEQILLDPAADNYRVLGSGPDTAPPDLRRNMALLLRWLHPDIGENSVRSVYAGRVTAAWERLKTAERRQAYGEELRERARVAMARRAERAARPGGGAVRPAGPGQAMGMIDPSMPARSRQAPGIFRRLWMSLMPGGRR